MLFNSIVFAIFLLIVFPLFWAVQRRALWVSNLLILVASYVFYGWWDYRFLGLIVISSVVDYWIGWSLKDAETSWKRKALLITSLVVNLGILGFFKYANFFADGFARLAATVGWQVDGFTLHVLLPVGISFYTFQTLSYTIDVYRGKVQPTQNLLAFFSYVAFFPQLVAGPIERASHLLPQFLTHKSFDRDQAVSGLRLMLWGFFKKMVIADQLAYTVDLVFGDPSGYGGWAIAIGILAFGLQIYGDFSGYSDIAIGTARLFGFEIMTNFRTPYFSTSFREFWQRWHISLSSWFRDYLYIPLGGNRVPQGRWIFNIMVTFVISGLWHGANYTFLIWGGLHGLFLLAERPFQNSVKLPKLLTGVFVFIMVNLAWVFFRSPDLHVAGEVFSQLFVASHGVSWADLVTPQLSPLVLVAALVFFILMEVWIGRADVDLRFRQIGWRPARWGLYYVIVAFILFSGAMENAPQFIYFQF